MGRAWRGTVGFVVGLCVLGSVLAIMAPASARAQALFPGGCPDPNGTITYSFAAGSAGTFVNASNTICQGRNQPGLWRYRYRYTVTSTLQNATFSITSPHESGLTITAPGVYSVVATFPGVEADHSVLSLGDPTDGPFDSESASATYNPALGLGYSTTATGPNPSGSVTVTIEHGTVDVPGSLATFTATPASTGLAYILDYVTGSGVLRGGRQPILRSPGAQITTSNGQGFALMQPGETYTFEAQPHPQGRMSAISCSPGGVTFDGATGRFTLTGQPDLTLVTCNATYAQQPTITGISPSTGPAAGGTAVTITGTNLSGVTAVRFGGVLASAFTINSATQITATAPAGTGTVGVTAQVNALANADTAADDFTYQAAPPPPPPAPAQPIPTLSEWAMILMGLLMAGLAFYRLRSPS